MLLGMDVAVAAVYVPHCASIRTYVYHGSASGAICRRRVARLLSALLVGGRAGNERKEDGWASLLFYALLRMVIDGAKFDARRHKSCLGLTLGKTMQHFRKLLGWIHRC